MPLNPRTLYQDQSVADAYDKERFHSLEGKIFDRLEKRAIAKALKVVPVGSHVLDLPCGTGRITELILEKGYQTMGVDLSPSMIRVATQKLQAFGSQIRFRVDDIEQLGLHGKAFECVTCIRFLSHFDTPERIKFLRTLARVSQRWVIIGISYSNPWYRFRRLLKQWISSSEPVRHPVSEQSLQRELKKSGLRISKRFFPMSILSEDLILLLDKE